MVYRIMGTDDIPKIAEMYVKYYNEHEGSCWTQETASRRIRQVVTTDDAICLMADDGGLPAGFLMGFLVQYDDIIAYRLEEVVVDAPYQNKGIGTVLVNEVAAKAGRQGAAMVELISISDDKHDRFYGGLGFQNANSQLIKTKWL